MTKPSGRPCFKWRWLPPFRTERLLFLCHSDYMPRGRAVLSGLHRIKQSWLASVMCMV